VRSSRLTVRGTAADDDEGGGDSCGDMGLAKVGALTVFD